jgi:hypothetical protein
LGALELGFDPEQFTDPEIVNCILDQAPKISAALAIIAEIVSKRKTKALVWVNFRGRVLG